jgi:hypothetical protein
MLDEADQQIGQVHDRRRPLGPTLQSLVVQNDMDIAVMIYDINRWCFDNAFASDLCRFVIPVVLRATSVLRSLVISSVCLCFAKIPSWQKLPVMFNISYWCSRPLVRYFFLKKTSLTIEC